MSTFNAHQFVEEKIRSNKAVVFSKTYCPYSRKAKAAFKRIGETPAVVELDEHPHEIELADELARMTHGSATVPKVFVAGKYFGGGDDTDKAAQSGELKEKLAQA